MQAHTMPPPQPADAGAYPCLLTLASNDSTPPEPYQLSLLLPTPDITPADAHHDTTDHAHGTNRPGRRRSRRLTRANVEEANRAANQGAQLRTSTGEFLPALYIRHETLDGTELKPADARIIMLSADALLAHRFRRGVKILRDPYLLLRFLRTRFVSQDQPVFAAFYLDRKQRLIRFGEIARGSIDRVEVHPREVLRDALECNAEQVICVRTDPIGDHEPTAQDFQDAANVKRTMNLFDIPLLDYLIVGKGITSLRQRFEK